MRLMDSPAWFTSFWPTGHFTKTWQLVGHVDKMMHKTTGSQDLKLREEDKWVGHWNYHTIANIAIYYKSLCVWCLWSRLFWHYRSFINTNVSGSKSETIVQFSACHPISVSDLTCFIIENVLSHVYFQTYFYCEIFQFGKSIVTDWFPEALYSLV